eukprot:gene4184-107_t
MWPGKSNAEAADLQMELERLHRELEDTRSRHTKLRKDHDCTLLAQRHEAEALNEDLRVLQQQKAPPRATRDPTDRPRAKHPSIPPTPKLCPRSRVHVLYAIGLRPHPACAHAPLQTRDLGEIGQLRSQLQATTDNLTQLQRVMDRQQ